MKRVVDLNCDLGESFGRWRMGNDEAILAHVTSANVACGFHAGDPAVMHATVRAALKHGVAVGAHPSLPDLQGFGRREMKLSADEAYDLTLYQIGALAGFTRAHGCSLHHVKPHGALYNMAAADAALAEAIACAVRDFDSGLVLYGLSGSELIRAGESAGLKVANEVFADRSYQADGSLTPRQRPDALIRDAQEAVEHVLRMLTRGCVRCVDGSERMLSADTICIHGDAPDAASFAVGLRAALAREGLEVRAP